ncbi:hypothetical protein AOG23_32935 [Rhizobium acidisoli]|nr:hypothetical protein AOG23_32935 [Rhizobium acidisoli]
MGWANERLEEEEKSMNRIMFRTVHRVLPLAKKSPNCNKGDGVSVPAANSVAMSPLVPSEVPRALL